MDFAVTADSNQCNVIQCSFMKVGKSEGIIMQQAHRLLLNIMSQFLSFDCFGAAMVIDTSWLIIKKWSLITITAGPLS